MSGALRVAPAILCLAALVGPLAGAQPAMPALPSAACAEAGKSPPCGYVNPIISLDFPKKPKCGNPGGPGAEACLPLPVPGTPAKYEGVVTFSWKESEDLTYPPDMQAPITLAFGKTSSNPSWISFTADPPSYIIEGTALLDPRNTKIDSSSGNPVLYYWYERPVNVTFTRTGDPTDTELARITSKEGVQDVYVRAHSTAMGSYFKEAFGGATFRFNALEVLPPPARPAPALPLAFAFAGLALAAMLARRS